MSVRFIPFTRAVFHGADWRAFGEVNINPAQVVGVDTTQGCTRLLLPLGEVHVMESEAAALALLTEEPNETQPADDDHPDAPAPALIEES